MKKVLLAVAFLGFTYAGAYAQTDGNNPESKAVLEFTNSTTHDFGKLQEGDPAVAEFTFKNTGDQPLIIQNVKPACGCTTPYWTKEPVAPGKTGTIKASYGTEGRPGSFNKSITVTSTGGAKVLYIKGVVNQAPEGSAPTNSSMMKSVN